MSTEKAEHEHIKVSRFSRVFHVEMGVFHVVFTDFHGTNFWLREPLYALKPHVLTCATN